MKFSINFAVELHGHYTVNEHTVIYVTQISSSFNLL